MPTQAPNSPRLRTCSYRTPLSTRPQAAVQARWQRGRPAPRCFLRSRRLLTEPPPRKLSLTVVQYVAGFSTHHRSQVRLRQSSPPRAVAHRKHVSTSAVNSLRPAGCSKLTSPHSIFLVGLPALAANASCCCFSVRVRRSLNAACVARSTAVPASDRLSSSASTRNNMFPAHGRRSIQAMDHQSAGGTHRRCSERRRSQGTGGRERSTAELCAHKVSEPRMRTMIHTARGKRTRQPSAAAAAAWPGPSQSPPRCRSAS